MNNSFYDFDLYAAPESNRALQNLQGRGQTGVLAVFEFENDREQDLQYLETILRPLKLDLQNDVFFLALQKKEHISIASVLQQRDIKFVLLFGGDPKDFGIRLQLPAYEGVKFQGSYFLLADALRQIRTDRENKDNRRAGALWNALKEMFAERLT